MPDPVQLAQLHAASFTTPRPWSAAEIAGLLDSHLAFLISEPDGFLIGRVIADEAELLTVCVAPALRRTGVGSRLMASFLQTAKTRGATTAFLEVSARNSAAIALYLAHGFAQSGCRRGYYHTPEGEAIDALIMAKPL